jgi:hypothetical protein
MIYKIILDGQTFECLLDKDEVYSGIYSGYCRQPDNENRHYFDYKFCWRGVWEGRLYFKDSEYWSEDLDLMNRIWIILENKLKEMIRESNPDIKKEYE